MSAPAASSSSLAWREAIPCTAASEADIAALEARYRLVLPATLRALLLQHSGEQVQPSMFWAQNVTNGKWKRESIGPIYPAATKKAPAAAAAADEEEEEDRYASYHVSVVNDAFTDNLLDEDALPAAIATPAAAADTPQPVPYFAFSESPESGHLLVLCTSTMRVMLLDVTRKQGPWIAAETVDDFLARLHNFPPKPDGEEEEEADAYGYGDEDEEGEMYCCDGCGDEFAPNDTRFHCEQCENYDLCASCKKRAEKGATDGHPPSHTFTAVQGGAHEEDEEEEKE